MKRILLVLLAAIMVFAVFACTKTEGDKPATTTTPGTTTPGTTTPGTTTPPETTPPPVTTEPDPAATLDLELQKFGGKSFRISTPETSSEVFAEESSSHILDIALNIRNSTIEDAYDVVMKKVGVPASGIRDHVHALSEWVTSGDDLYDVSLTNAHSSSPMIANGLVKNWNNKDVFKYNNFSKNYWMNDINEDFVIAGALYSPVGDMCISVLSYTYVVLFNRTKGDQLFVDEGTTTVTEDVFNKIDNMEWTIDYFIELTSNIYKDIDDINGPSENDLYGFTSDRLTSIDVWQFAFDIPMIARHETDYIVPVIETEKTYQMVDKLRHLYLKSNGSNTGDSDEHMIANFRNGNAVFATAVLTHCVNRIAGMGDTHTILPYPMWDENQGKYLGGAMDNYSLISVPITCKDPGMVSYLIEVLNYESRENIFPVYYENVLKNRADDYDSIRMLDLVVAGRSFDLGTLLYEDTQGYPLVVRWAVDGDKDFSYMYGEIKRQVIAGVKYFVRKYKENANL